jgi:hypothetical protein
MQQAVAALNRIYYSQRMCYSGRMYLSRKCGIRFPWFLGMGILLLCISSPGQETNQFAVGIRGGVASSETSFFECEAFVNRDLHRRWDLGAGFWIRPRLEFTSGLLTRYSEYGYVGTLGPGVVLRYDKLPLSVNAGSRLTYLSQSAFGNRDFGIHFQFTTHCGIDWHVFGPWEIGYRFQHMSNGGLGKPNPGLNMHLFGGAYRF